MLQPAQATSFYECRIFSGYHSLQVIKKGIQRTSHNLISLRRIPLPERGDIL